MHQPKAFNPPWIDYFTSPCPYYVNQYTMFTLFPNLPKELQLLIWSVVKSAPQVIHVTVSKKWETASAQELSGPTEPDPWFRIDNYKPPELLHVCHDSRMQALKSYLPAFPTQLARPIYMNFKRDRLHFTSHYTARCFYALTPYSPESAIHMDSLQHLSVHVPFEMQSKHFKIMCGQFSGLKTLYLMHRPTTRTRLDKYQFPLVLDPKKNTKFWEKYRPVITNPIYGRLDRLENWQPPKLVVGSEEQWARKSNAASLGEPMDWSYTIDLPSLEFKPIYGRVDLGLRSPALKISFGPRMVGGSMRRDLGGRSSDKTIKAHLGGHKMVLK